MFAVGFWVKMFPNNLSKDHVCFFNCLQLAVLIDVILFIKCSRFCEFDFGLGSFSDFSSFHRGSMSLSSAPLSISMSQKEGLIKLEPGSPARHERAAAGVSVTPPPNRHSPAPVRSNEPPEKRSRLDVDGWHKDSFAVKTELYIRQYPGLLLLYVNIYIL